MNETGPSPEFSEGTRGRRRQARNTEEYNRGSAGQREARRQAEAAGAAGVEGQSEPQAAEAAPELAALSEADAALLNKFNQNAQIARFEIESRVYQEQKDAGASDQKADEVAIAAADPQSDEFAKEMRGDINKLKEALMGKEQPETEEEKILDGNIEHAGWALAAMSRQEFEERFGLQAQEQEPEVEPTAPAEETDGTQPAAETGQGEDQETGDTAEQETTGSTETGEQNPEAENVRRNFTSKKEALAVITAKRQNSFRSSEKDKEAFQKADQEYREALIELGQLEEAEYVAENDTENRTEEQQRLDVMTRLLEHEQALRENVNEKLKNTKRGKFIEWMNRGGRGKRFLKGMAFSGGFAVVGAATAGVGLGAFAAGAGITAAVGSRVALYSARVDANRRGTSNETSQEAAQILATQANQGVEQAREDQTRSSSDLMEAVAIRQEAFEQDTQQQQKERRKSLGKGALIAAGSLVAGRLAAEGASEAAAWWNAGGQEWTQDQFNRGVEGAQDAGRATGEAIQDAHQDIQQSEQNATDISDHRDAQAGGGEQQPGGSEQQPGGQGLPETGPVNAAEFFSGEAGTVEFSEAGVESMLGHLDGYTVQQGDTIWGLSEQYLQANGVENPSVYQVDAVKDKMVPVLQEAGYAEYDQNAHDGVYTEGWLRAGDTFEFMTGDETADTGGDAGGGAENSGDSGANQGGAAQEQPQQQTEQPQQSEAPAEPAEPSTPEDTGGEQAPADAADNQAEAEGAGEAARLLSEQGVNLGNDSITFERSVELWQISDLLDEYFGVDLSPAQYETLLERMSGQDFSGYEVPAGTYIGLNENVGVTEFVRGYAERS